MKGLLGFVAATAAVWGGAAHAQQSALPTQAEMRTMLAQTKVPSVSIAVVRDGKVVATQAYGEAAPGRAATPETLYNVASLTKPVSAEVVLRLAAEDRLTLDEPMSRAWVDPDLASDPRAGRLTARVALSHRTGFPNWRGAGPLAFQSEPGSKFGYSGEGYNYVTRFAEQRAGRALDRLGEELIFRPAGMTSTSYVGQPWFDGRIALPTTKDGERLKPTIAERANAADLLYTTAADYGRFMAYAMAGGADLARLRQTMETPVPEWCPPTKAGCPQALGFGPGWEVARIGGRAYLMHTGRDPGVFTLAYMRPDNQSGLVILTNSELGHTVMLPLLEKLADKPFVDYLKARVG